MSDCVFCRIIAGTEPAEVIADWVDALAIVPLKQYARGHTIVMPRVHVENFVVEPIITGMVMARAAEVAGHLRLHPANLITSAGREATQDINHLHVHILPRKANDGLALPWYSGKSRQAS